MGCVNMNPHVYSLGNTANAWDEELTKSVVYHWPEKLIFEHLN